jgi:hypothetical protein
VCLYGRSFSVEGIVLRADQFSSWLGEALGSTFEAALNCLAEDRCSELLRQAQTNALK